MKKITVQLSDFDYKAARRVLKQGRQTIQGFLKAEIKSLVASSNLDHVILVRGLDDGE